MQSHVLFVDSNIGLQTLVSLNLTIYVGVEVIIKDNLEEAIELLKNNDSIDLIITRNKINEEKVALEIYKFLNSNDKKIPLIVLGPEHFLEKFAQFVDDNFEIKDLIRACSRILQVTPKDMMAMEVPDYYPIPIIYFFHMEKTKCAIYLRIKTPEGYQYLKRFAQGDEITLHDIQSFLKKGVKHLYVPKDFRLKIANEVTLEILAKLKSQDLSEIDKLKYSNAGMTILKQAVGTSGLSPETIELANATLDNMKKIALGSPKLRSLLNSLLENQSSFLYKHCQLITFISFHAIDNLEWGSTEQQEKLAFVALFHDICLELDEMAIIHSEEDLKHAHLKDEQKHQVTTHALNAAKLVQSFPKSPLGSDIIIKQHHGSLNGAGFAKSYSNNLSPLAIVFIIAEEFTHYLLTSQKQTMDRNVFIEELYKKYTKSLYKRVIKGLENLEIN